MPIVVKRTGELVSAPVLPQEQQKKLWEIIVRNWLQAHPETLKEEMKCAV